MTKARTNTSSTPANAGAGRPSRYRTEFANQAKRLYANGAIDREVADHFGITTRTLHNWRNQFEEFLLASKVGREIADDRVERSLYQRAIGYEREVEKAFMPAGAVEPVIVKLREEVLADVGAIKLWLMNRRPDRWRERSNVTHSVPEHSPIAKMVAACMGTGFRPKESAATP